jgi:hypothetical protein
MPSSFFPSLTAQLLSLLIHLLGKLKSIMLYVDSIELIVHCMRRLVHPDALLVPTCGLRLETAVFLQVPLSFRASGIALSSVV